MDYSKLDRLFACLQIKAWLTHEKATDGGHLTWKMQNLRFISKDCFDISNI